MTRRLVELSKFPAFAVLNCVDDICNWYTEFKLCHLLTMGYQGYGMGDVGYHDFKFEIQD